MKTFLLKLDLQLFAADGTEFGSYDPQTAYEGIEGYQAPAVEETPPAEPVQEEPAQGEPTPQDLLDFGGRKLPANEDLMGLHKDFTEQQRYITALQEQVNAYKQLAQVQGQPQAQPQAQPAEQVSSNMAEWDEETWNKFYENPNQILDAMVGQKVQSIIEEQVGPILQERMWNQQISRMYESYPDFDQYVGEVQALIQQQPDKYANRDGGLEDAYFRAKATKGFSQSPQQLAQDPQFIQQYVLSNPQVQQQLLNQYFQNKEQVNNQLPVNMGRGAGGYTPQSPQASPQTLKEASRAFLKQLGYR